MPEISQHDLDQLVALADVGYNAKSALGVYDMEREIQRLTEEVEDMRAALADAIRRPMGVIPNSARRFVTDEDLAEAEKRRTGATP